MPERPSSRPPARWTRAVGVPFATLALVLSSVLAAAAAMPGSDGLVDARTVAASELVADAGASRFVQAGDYATFIGNGFGGIPPYTYSWSTSAGTIPTPDDPSIAVDTEGVAAGDHTVTLTVTDATGATATDDVTFRVAGEPAVTELLSETRTVGQPGVTGVSPYIEFEVDVPEGTPRIDVLIEWSVPANDFDLRVLDPEGEEQASSGNAPPATTEQTGVVDPVPGTWTVAVEQWATGPEPSLTATVTAPEDAAGDPVPVLDAGGPYRFVTGDPQRLDGEVSGGSEPYDVVGWDTDLDGEVDVEGQDPELDLPPGRHLVTLHVRDAAGFENQRMTSVLVGSAERITDLTVPLTVIGIADSGINPYHAEFSAATYPDAEVLELTRNFTRHPSEYIPGYPADAKMLPATIGKGYFPPADEYLWRVNESESGAFQGEFVADGQLYWIPGTKIIGALDAGGSTGVTSGADTHPILDDNGHGTGSTSVSAGNRYGYCGTCLLVLTEALDESVAAKYDWIDISSNSFGYIGGLPVGYVDGPSEVTKAAAERGQTTLFAAGNGVGNTFFDAPILTYGSDQTGPDWNITVGAIREDNQEAIISDGLPAHVSNLGDGDLPSACRTGEVGQCAFGGTSAATPYTAGVFGTVLREIRDVLGDWTTGQQHGGQVVARGPAVAGSPYLDDGELTRRELRAAVLKTAVPRFGDAEVDPNVLPQSYEGPAGQVAFQGYGAAGPASARRAIEVLLGERPMPLRAEEDQFFQYDCQARDEQYGSYDRDGDGEADACADAHIAFVDRFIGDGEATNDDPATSWFDPARDAVAQDGPTGDPMTYYLHRRVVAEPDRELAEDTCGENDNELWMDRTDSEGDLDPCFDSRITSTVASFRPKGIFAATDLVTEPLPAGSQVEVVAYLQINDPATEAGNQAGTGTQAGVGLGGPFELGAELKATDRVVGSASSAGAAAPGGWTEVTLTFETERPVAAGEQLSFHFLVTGAQSYAFGYEGDHASRITLTPAADTSALDFGVVTEEIVDNDDGTVTVRGRAAFPSLGEDPDLAGFHPVSHQVEVAVDEDFHRAVVANVDPVTGRWEATLPGDDDGTVRARALRDRWPSPTATGIGASAGAPVPAAPEPDEPAADDEGVDRAPAGPSLPATGGGAALLGLGALAGAFAASRRRRV